MVRNLLRIQTHRANFCNRLEVVIPVDGAAQDEFCVPLRCVRFPRQARRGSEKNPLLPGFGNDEGARYETVALSQFGGEDDRPLLPDLAGFNRCHGACPLNSGTRAFVARSAVGIPEGMAFCSLASLVLSGRFAMASSDSAWRQRHQPGHRLWRT